MVERPGFTDGRWIPPGRPATVVGHAIPGGLMYVGRHLRTRTGKLEPALINPDLPVAASDAPIIEPGTGPALAYHLISPAARAAYLRWLAGGRDTEVSASLVLLFCFGLESRVLADADHDPAVRRELPAITAEVRRLRTRYGGGGPMLRGTLERLLDLLELLTAPRVAPIASPDPGAPKSGPPGSDAALGPAVARAERACAVGRASAPMAVRVALARFAAASAPVPANWARAWARHHPSLTPRSAQRRCPDEFDRLFTLRYRARHGSGLVPPGDVPGIRMRYQPASPALNTTVVCREDLPDVLSEPRVTRALSALVDDVAATLGPYRRWLARFPQGRGSLAAATLLPPELIDTNHGPLGALRVWAESRLDGRPRVVIDAAEFAAFWSTATPDRMARDEAAALLAVLALLGFGVEPDVRFGAPTLVPGPAVLFLLARPAADRPGAGFPTAAALARCAAAVASAAGPVEPQGPVGAAVLATARDLAAALRLDPGEDLRLSARLSWLLTTEVDLDRLGRQTALLTVAERELAGRYLIAVAAAADPAVGPATVATLTRVYRILGLEPNLVFHRIHEQSVGAAAGPLVIPVSRPPGSTRPVAPAPPLAPTRSTGAAGPAGPMRPDIRPEPAEPGTRDEPVVVRAGDAGTNGYALPWADTPPPSATPPPAAQPPAGPGAYDGPAPGGVPLDPSAIMRTLAESAAAATLLTAIFDNEPSPDQDQRSGADAPLAAVAPPDGERHVDGAKRAAAGSLAVATVAGAAPPAEGVDQVAGLDLAHSLLLRALATRPSWTPDEYAALACGYGVLPEGALDLLNEVAMDAVGAPVVEDDGRLTVDNDVLLELLA